MLPRRSQRLQNMDPDRQVLPSENLVVGADAPNVGVRAPLPRRGSPNGAPLVLQVSPLPGSPYSDKISMTPSRTWSGAILRRPMRSSSTTATPSFIMNAPTLCLSGALSDCGHRLPFLPSQRPHRQGPRPSSHAMIGHQRGASAGHPSLITSRLLCGQGFSVGSGHRPSSSFHRRSFSLHTLFRRVFHLSFGCGPPSVLVRRLLILLHDGSGLPHDARLPSRS
jgi:hypothetical protein